MGSTQFVLVSFLLQVLTELFSSGKRHINQVFATNSRLDRFNSFAESQSPNHTSRILVSYTWKRSFSFLTKSLFTLKLDKEYNIYIKEKNRFEKEQLILFYYNVQSRALERFWFFRCKQTRDSISSTVCTGAKRWDDRFMKFTQVFKLSSRTD